MYTLGLVVVVADDQALTEASRLITSYSRILVGAGDAA